MSGRGRVTKPVGHRVTSSPPTVPNRNTTPVFLYATTGDITTHFTNFIDQDNFTIEKTLLYLSSIQITMLKTS